MLARNKGSVVGLLSRRPGRVHSFDLRLLSKVDGFFGKFAAWRGL